jgi:hypothetical protein
MQNYLFYRKDNGLVTQVGAVPASEISLIYVPAHLELLEIVQEVNYETSRVVNGAVVTIPKQPTPNHYWENDGWVDPTTVAQLKEAKQIDISIERERLNSLPITYAGAQFDATSTAQRNVSAWMTNIANGQNPPSGFTWRGYDNVDHPADASFIVALGNAITLRGSYLYQRSWIKKAEVDALTTAAQVKAYDITTGW